MRVHQYVYFSLRSDRLPSREMATRLGMEPDEISVKGSKRENPPVPAVHSWRVVCRDSGLTVDEQIDRIIDRLGPIADQIAALVRVIDEAEGEGITSTLQVVRYFNDDDGDQHQRLGWHLDRRALEFLHHTRAELDVDEYGDD
ncbi:DUF4279 domain-containing protein [Micromonospora sp. NBC_00362]|uniref:DUF4279 domain-containing protein n=1 Tax=Micromonospora sp. NBC_00362 TaxID=2975975 RepID=UPI00224CED5F|nr:DUF4279 domain-containing protein [Micromonospora sp. NBC_00362]MCX5117886.1 DUF4279 domain-containing protein [Micromonospora sp. NBC_00362]